MENDETLNPQQCRFRRGGAKGFAKAPAVSGGGKREKEEKEEWGPRTFGEDRDDCGPRYVAGMDEKAESRSRLLATAEQHQDQDSVSHVEDEKAIRRP